MPVLRPIGWAIVVYLVVCLVSAVATIGLGFPEGAGLPDIAVYIPGILVGTPIIGLLMLVSNWLTDMEAFYTMCPHLSAKPIMDNENR